MNERHIWEPVTHTFYTHRMKVAGGYLYLISLNGYPAMVFVPYSEPPEVRSVK